jgi:hypothetical protein
MKPEDFLVKHGVFKKSQVSSMNLTLYRDGHIKTQEDIIKAMTEFAEESKKGLFTAKAMQEFAIEVANYDRHSNPRKSIDTHLEDFLQWYKDEDC